MVPGCVARLEQRGPFYRRRKKPGFGSGGLNLGARVEIEPHVTSRATALPSTAAAAFSRGFTMRANVFVTSRGEIEREIARK